jgi:hypothetical protein
MAKRFKYDFLTGQMVLVDSAPGVAATKYYKCASVDTVNKTWTGYELLDSTVLNGVFSETLTTGLSYTGMFPIVGHVYDASCLIVAGVNGPAPVLVSPTNATADSFGVWTFSAKDYESDTTRAYKAFDGNLATRYTQAPYNSLPLWFQAKRTTSFVPKSIILRHGSGSGANYGTAFTVYGINSDNSVTAIKSFTAGVDFVNEADSGTEGVKCNLDFSTNATPFYGVRVTETSHNQGWADFLVWDCAIYAQEAQ